MIKYKYILFDLDGTVSESAAGIRKSLEYALTSLKKPVPDLGDYTRYIGPPLIDTFRGMCRLSEEEGREATELYRQYYNEKGKYFNKAYDGIEELLKRLKAEDAFVAVCSSKYEKFAQEIIRILGLSEYFDAVCGSNLDGSRKDKRDLIPYALKSLGASLENDRKNSVLIGDTFYDAKGARQSQIDFIGAAYGYGDTEKMRAEGAELFAEAPLRILDFLTF